MGNRGRGILGAGWRRFLPSFLSPPIVVNVCVRGSYGWLFDDLREGFVRAHVPGIRVIASEEPNATADAWIFIRTAEAGSSPDLARTVVCIHDLFAHSARGLYSLTGERGAVHRAAGLVLCHPGQRDILTRAGVSFQGKMILDRPLGALKSFYLGRIQYDIGCTGELEHIAGSEVDKQQAGAAVE